MITKSKKSFKKKLLKDIPSIIYKNVKIHNNCNFNFNSWIKKTYNYIDIYFYNKNISNIINLFLNFIKNYDDYLIALSLILNINSFSINYHLFFFIFNSFFYFILYDDFQNKLLFQYILSIIYPPFSTFLYYCYYKKKDISHRVSDRFLFDVFLKPLSYYITISGLFSKSTNDFLLSVLIIKTFAETYIGPLQSKFQYNWLNQEKVGYLILGAEYENNIKFFNLRKLTFLKKIFNSYSTNLITELTYIFPFFTPLFMVINPLFFNLQAFMIFCFHLFIFLGSGILFSENICLALSALFLYTKFNVLNMIITYLYIIYNLNKNTKKLMLGWLDSPFYTRYSIVLKTIGNKHILLNSQSLSNPFYIFQHRYMRIFDPLGNVSSSENGQMRDHNLHKLCCDFVNNKFKNIVDCKNKLNLFHDKHKKVLKNASLKDWLIKYSKYITKKYNICTGFYDNVNKKNLIDYYSNNLNYINEIQNNILNISEIHLHISKAAYIEQFNDFVEYKSTIIKDKVKVKINI